MTRKTGGAVQRSRSETGMVLLCPIDVGEEELQIGDPLKLLHAHLSATLVEQLSGACGDEAAKPSSPRCVAGSRDDLIRQIGVTLLQETLSETAGGRLLIDALSLALTGRLAQKCLTSPVAEPAALQKAGRPR